MAHYQSESCDGSGRIIIVSRDRQGNMQTSTGTCPDCG